MKKPTDCLHMMLKRAVEDKPSPNSYGTKMYDPTKNLEAIFKCDDCGTFFFEIVSSEKKPES